MPRDLPVCFPDRPCVDFSPFEADAINLTSGLTPASLAIAIGCFAVLGTALVMVVVGLTWHPRRSGPSLWVVAVATALVIGGAVVTAVVDLRFWAILSIYGRDGPGSPDLYGSWWLVGMAGEAMAIAGLVALATTAAVAVLLLARDSSPGVAPIP